MVQFRFFRKNSGENLRLVDLLRSEMQAQSLRTGSSRSSSEPRDITARNTSDQRLLSGDKVWTSGKRLSARPSTNRKHSLSYSSIHRRTHVKKRNKGRSSHPTEETSETVASSISLPEFPIRIVRSNSVTLAPNRWDAPLGQPFADALPSGETPKIPRDDPILEGCMKMKRVSAERVGIFVDSKGPASAGTLEFMIDEGERSKEESVIAEQKRGISNRYGGQIARVLVVEKDYLGVEIPAPNIFI